jgi:hypothetical protein
VVSTIGKGGMKGLIGRVAYRVSKFWQMLRIPSSEFRLSENCPVGAAGRIKRLYPGQKGEKGRDDPLWAGIIGEGLELVLGSF